MRNSISIQTTNFEPTRHRRIPLNNSSNTTIIRTHKTRISKAATVSIRVSNIRIRRPNRLDKELHPDINVTDKTKVHDLKDKPIILILDIIDQEK